MQNIMKFLKEIEPRKYQEEIFETCKEKNCLVILPTGIGKTLVALMLTIDRMIKFPESKVLFLAPTRPLAEQHLAYFKKHLPELFADMQLFTGKVNAEKRKKIWQSADIIFSTPQCIANDLKNNLYNLEEVSLLIEDECHRCLRNYAYTFVAQKYREQAKNPRILGLTASPGHEKAKINEICKNLEIEAVEIRTRESEDVKEYLQKLKFEIIKLDFPEEFNEIRKLLKKLFDKKVEELKNRKLLFMPATKKNLLELQARLMRQIGTGSRHFNILSGASACAQTIKLQHALELLETQTLGSLQNYIYDLFDQAKQGKSKAVQQIVKQPEFNKAYIKLTELLARKIENPKLQRLREIVEDEIKKKKNTKIIVFAQYRDTVVKICRELNSLQDAKAKVFIGQAKKGEEEGERGLSQREQQEIIKEFSLGQINLLCATSVHPEEYIILKKDNKIVIKQIGEFVDSFIKKEANEKRTSQKISGWKALTSDGEKLLFKPITHVHKHETQNRVIKVKLNSGFDTLITENHSLFSFNYENRFLQATPEKDKFVFFVLNCKNLNKNNNKIDVIKEIYENCPAKEQSKLFGSIDGLTQAKIRMLKTEVDVLFGLGKEKLSILSLSKLTKRDYSVVTDCLNRSKKQGFVEQERLKRNYRNISRLTARGRSYLNFLKWFFDNVKYRKGKYRFSLLDIKKNPQNFNDFFKQNINVYYGKSKYPRLIELNESLARFLGFYVSEGSTRKTRYTADIFLAARNKKMQEMMIESVKNGLKLKIRKNWRGIAIDSQIAYYLIRDVFRAGIGAYNKEVPDVIFTSPRNIKWEFLKAYFLGDGYSDNNRIVLTTVSRKLVTGLVLLLRMLNIKKITLYRQRNIYRLCISESLPFAKIKEKNEKRGHAYYSLIPQATKNKKAFDLYKNFFSVNNSYLKCRKNGKWDTKICLDYIKEIREIEKPKFVYDISVKDTESFIGGTGLFCLHNSIGEEGLDLPEVNAVIFYEPIPSAIRQIQRRGRTARLIPGKLIILMLKGTRDEGYYWAAFHKEKKMYKILDGIKEELENNFNKKNKESKEKEEQKTLLKM